MPTGKCYNCVVYEHDSLWVSLFFISILFGASFLSFHFAVFHQLNNEQQHFINVHEFSLQCTFRGDFEHIQNNTLAICLCNSSASHIVIVICLNRNLIYELWLMYYYDRPVNPLSTVQLPASSFHVCLDQRPKLINDIKESNKTAIATQNKQRTSHHIPSMISQCYWRNETPTMQLVLPLFNFIYVHRKSQKWCKAKCSCWSFKCAI